MDPHLRRLVFNNLTKLLPTTYMKLSQASLADALTDGVLNGLDASASYAYHVHDSKIQAVWEGAKALGRRE